MKADVNATEQHGPEKHALGLGPRMDTGFPKKHALGLDPRDHAQSIN
jgi:hypothetical protein